jgi:hypothetical protein
VAELDSTFLCRRLALGFSIDTNHLHFERLLLLGGGVIDFLQNPRVQIEISVQ